MFYNPYHDKNFWEFFGNLFVRFFQFITGQLEMNQLVSDEIQILVLSGVAASSALIGTFLVLRRMTMLANSLSHTILIGIVLAYFFTPPFSSNGHQSIAMQSMLIASLITGFLTAFLTEFLTKK
jgi:manganese/zinc/iron transport system permease protein